MDAIPLTLQHATGKLMAPPQVEAILGTLLTLSLTFLDADDAAYELPDGTTGRLVCKAPQALGGETVLLDSAWAHTTGETTYTLATLANSTQLQALIDAADGDDADFILRAQIEWQLPAETDPRKSRPFDLLIINSPARSDDTAPDVAGNAAWDWLKNRIAAGANLTRTVDDVTKVMTLSAEDADANTAAIAAHTGNTSNPHSVTKSQVGLGNADNTSDANKPVSTAQQTAIDLLAPKTLPLNAQTGTSYTLVIGDVCSLVTLSNASAITLTVPPNADVAFAVGTQVVINQLGAGQVTVSPGSGVTLNSRGARLKIAGQYGAATLIKTATNTWTLAGDLSA